jgi:hypothetical protein
MDKRKYWFFGSKLNTALLLILIILMIIALKFMFANKQTYFPYVPSQQPTSGEVKGNNESANPTPVIKDENHFKGTITEVDNGCWVDAACSIELDNKTWVIYNPGRVLNEQAIGIIQGDFSVGSHVEVYAQKITYDRYTIVGNTKYYIKVVK